jgi:hypothetical protein
MVRKREQITRIVGWLWLLLAAAGLAHAVFMIYSDLRRPEAEDPAGVGFVLGLVFALALFPLAFCGAALVQGWRGTIWWLLLPAGLIAWFTRSYFL